jgi:hypothetical protein
MRRLAPLLSLLLVVVGCSSGSGSGDIAFEHVRAFEGTSVWTATGEAIDDGLFCPAATGVLEGFEHEDGVAWTEDDSRSLFGGGEPFTIVSVESMTCDDGSGEFTLNFIDEVDPSEVPERDTKRTWTITGGSGYDTTSGEGDHEFSAPDEDLFFNGTGTIAKD